MKVKAWKVTHWIYHCPGATAYVFSEQAAIDFDRRFSEAVDTMANGVIEYEEVVVEIPDDMIVK
jgi:hypothetical protein